MRLRSCFGSAFTGRSVVILVLALLAVSAGWAGTVYDYVWSGPTTGGIWQDQNWNQSLATGPLGGYSGIPTASVYIGQGNVVTIGGSPLNNWAAAGTLTIASGSQLVVPGQSSPPYFQIGSGLINGGDILLGDSTGGAISRRAPATAMGTTRVQRSTAAAPSR